MPTSALDPPVARAICPQHCWRYKSIPATRSAKPNTGGLKPARRWRELFSSPGGPKPSRVVFSLGNCLTLPDNTRHQPFTGNTENRPLCSSCVPQRTVPCVPVFYRPCRKSNHYTIQNDADNWEMVLTWNKEYAPDDINRAIYSNCNIIPEEHF